MQKKRYIFYYLVTPPTFKAHYCYKTNIKFISPLTTSTFVIALPIYKCLSATSNFIQNTFNLKKTPQIIVDFLLIFLQKIDGGFHDNE